MATSLDDVLNAISGMRDDFDKRLTKLENEKPDTSKPIKADNETQEITVFAIVKPIEKNLVESNLQVFAGDGAGGVGQGQALGTARIGATQRTGHEFATRSEAQAFLNKACPDRETTGEYGIITVKKFI